MPAKKTKAKSFTPVANTELAAANAARAFGGSWGTHLDTRAARARTRSAAKNRAIRDSRNS